MVEQRQEQRLRLLLTPPALVLLVIAAFALLTERDPGNGLRENTFDLFMRLAPRPVAEEPFPVAAIVIDAESTEKVGSWPWPRTAYASLVDAAEAAGARSISLAISVSGDDPLSPDVIARRWLPATQGEEAQRLEALATLPSNDLALARSIAGSDVALGIAPQLRGTAEAVEWERTDPEAQSWMRLAGGTTTDSLAVPAVLGTARLSAELREARLQTVAGLPLDPGGKVRRLAPVYGDRTGPLPAAPLAPFALTGEPIVLTTGSLTNAGPRAATLKVGDADALPLDERSELRLWLPQDLAIPTVPAWRVLDDPAAWTAGLDGQHVFIGEVVTPSGVVDTARGTLPAVILQSLAAGQISQGVAPSRPGWAGFGEAFAAILFGTLAVAAVLYLPALLAAAGAVLLAFAGFLGAYFTFRGTGMLIDPTPAMMGSFAGPLAVGVTVLVNMVVRDDAVRGAFHGALPQKAMRKLQSQGGRRLLQGVHREVTVLSCAYKLPPELIARFAKLPRDYVLFQASANDRLRRTILEHEGTVDYGEDGRLLGYWNVPIEESRHIELACSCALKMLDDVSVMSQQVSESHHVSPGGPLEELADGRIEIGIASGPAFAGPVGLGGRNRYAALGQPVSLAGRLRQRSELYGPAILTDAAVYEALRHHYAFLDLDIVRRDTHSSPEAIYGLVGNPFLKASKSFRQLAEVQRDLLEAWRVRDLTSATRQLQKLRGIPGVPQPYVELFERRIMDARLSKARREDDYADILGL
jgi:adenylate cyclase